MLSRLERRLLAGAVVVALLLVVGAVVVVVRWPHVKAWLDAPEVLRVNAAVLAIDLPGEDDPTRTAAAWIGATRAAWSDLAPREAATRAAAALAERDVDVEPVLCDDPALPAAPLGGTVACGARVGVHDEELWVLATDRTPRGGVPLGRTVLWFAWDGTDMSMPLAERLLAEDPDVEAFASDPQVPDADQVEALLPPRYRGVTAHCWGEPPAGEACTIWEAPVDLADLADLPAADQVAALVRELVHAGYFVEAADPAWAGDPLTARRMVAGWTGVDVRLRLTDDGPVARVAAM